MVLRVRDGEGDLETTSCDVMADVGRTSSKCDEGDPGGQADSTTSTTTTTIADLRIESTFPVIESTSRRSSLHAGD